MNSIFLIKAKMNKVTPYIRLFEYYKFLGEKTFDQLEDEDLFYLYNEESNSRAMMVKHLYGNMLSRWTDFLTTDGEKEWRNRDAEFEDDIRTRAQMMELWHKGWKCLLDTLNMLSDEDMDKTVLIRNQEHTAEDAIQRQLAHYPYHIGQIVYIGKMRAVTWMSLSIPRGASQSYNQQKFNQDRNDDHFTDDLMKKL